jgi:hypothetical protein
VALTYKIYLCGGDDRLFDPDPSCSRNELHTPQPRSYVDWFEWAGQMNYKGHAQHKCPGCGRYMIWSGGRE